MCLSTFYALVIGFYLAIVSFAMLVHQPHFKKIAKELNADHPLILFSGLLGVVFGLIIVITHDVWMMNWRVFITLIGWIILISGIMRIYFPHHFINMIKNLHARVSHLVINGGLLIVGLYLLWEGFSK